MVEREGTDAVRVGDPPVGGRYSLVEPFGADERFAGGKVQTWRARDTLVERDVVLRVITPGGNSARLFLDRALEMSLIAHPGLGMVYEAVDHGAYAIVVCEWIDGTSLAETLTAHGPLTPATARQTLGDVAEAITVAHHAGLPIGGITAERVVLRDNASVTVSAVPALFADERGDIQQLGELLYAALTGQQPDLDDPDLARNLHRGVPRDLAVLCQRALDPDPARQLGSAAAFAAVLRPQARPPSPPRASAGRAGDRLGGLDPDLNPRTHDTDPALLPQAGDATPDNPTTARRALPLPALAQSGRADDPDRMGSAGESGGSGEPSTAPIPSVGGDSAIDSVGDSDRALAGALAGALADDYDPWSEDTGTWGSYTDDDSEGGGSYEGGQTRRKVLLYAVPLAALLLVVLLGVFVGKQFSAVVTDESGAVVPSAESTSTEGEPTEGEPTEAPGAPIALPPVSAAVFDPFGDGQPENDGDVGLAYDGDVSSAWQTLTYQNTPEFGNLKPGVGVIFDLGEERTINAIELATNLPGSAIEIRVGAAPDAALDSYPVVGTLDPFTDSGSVALAEPVRARFVIVWFVRLVEANGGFQGALAECRILGT